MGFEEDAGAAVDGGLHRASLLLLVQRSHAACHAVLRVSLLGNCAQRHLRVVSAWFVTALFCAAPQFLLLMTATGFRFVGLQLEPRWRRLWRGRGEAIGIAERFHLTGRTNHHQKHWKEDKAIEETQENQGEKNQEEISGKSETLE